MANPISTPIVADLPENWTNGQTVAANGADAGLSQQHGYNYLNGKINESLRLISTLNTHAGTAYTTNNKPTASDVGAVPTTRTVNGKALSANITLSASDVSARASTWTPTASQVSAGTFTGRVQGNVTAMGTVANMQFRDTALVKTETVPTNNGTINWVYE